MGSVSVLLLLFIHVSAWVGLTLPSCSSQLYVGGGLFRYYFAGGTEDARLEFQLTRFSGGAKLYWNETEGHDSGEGSYIEASGLRDSRELLVGVECTGPCRYALTVVCSGETELSSDFPLERRVVPGRVATYYLRQSESAAHSIDPLTPCVNLTSTLIRDAPVASRLSYSYSTAARLDIHSESECTIRATFKFYLDDAGADIEGDLTVFSGYPRVGLRTNNTEIVMEFRRNSNSFVLESDERRAKGLSTGEYFLTITSGNVPADFSIVLKFDQQSSIVILSGMPQKGCVQPGKAAKYSLYPPTNNNSNLTISVFPTFGVVVLTVRHCDNFVCNQSSPVLLKLSPASNGIDSGELPLNSLRGYFDLTLEASTEPISAYTLLWSDNSDECTLRLSDGEPVQIIDTVPRIRKYAFKVTDREATTVVVQITQRAGSVRLTVIQHHSGHTVEKQSRSDFVLFEKGVDGESLEGTYIVETETHYPAAFAIVAFIDNTEVTLRPGHWQKRWHSDQIRYSFAVQSDSRPFLAISALEGRFDLHTSEDVSFSSPTLFADISSSTLNSTIEVLTATHPRTVYSKLTETSSPSLCFLMAYSDSTPIHLSEHIPITDVLAEGYSRLYIFPLLSPGVGLSVSLTAFSGDPDLSISTTDRSLSLTYDSIGSKAVYLSWDSELKLACDQLPCYLSFTITAFRTSIYELSVSATSAIPKPLDPSRPKIAYMQKDEIEYFYALISPRESIEFRLHSFYGNCGLYASVHPGDVSPDNWPLPVAPKGSFRYGGIFRNVNLTSDTVAADCSGPQCAAVFGVHCLATHCQHILYARTEFIVLAEGLPFEMMLAGNRTYYFQLYNREDRARLWVHLSYERKISVSMYVAAGVEVYPGQRNGQWEFAGEGSFEITRDGDVRGYYSIALVSPVTTALELSYTASSLTPIYLSPGLPHRSSLLANSTHYYSFHNQLESDLTITVTPLSGLIALYVSTSVSSILVSKSNCLWSSPLSHTPREIHISTENDHFCVHCSFLVLVTAAEDAEFLIDVGNLSNQTVLQNGVPTHGELIRQQTNTYLYDVVTATGFTVAVTTFSGDADVYVGYTPATGPGSYTWASSSDGKVDVVRVSENDPGFSIGTVYVGVYGKTDSSYVITAHGRDTYIQLVDGWPHVYVIDTSIDDHLFFVFPVSPQRTPEVECHIKPLTKGFHPRARAVFNSPPTLPPLTDATQHRNYENAFGEILIQLRTAPWKLNIGVYSQPDGNELLGLFSLVCYGNADENILQEGVQAFGIIAEGNPYKKYLFQAAETGTLEVVVLPCSGSLLLSVASADSDFRNSTLSTVTSGRLVATVPKASGQYRITVSSTSATFASFQITAQMHLSTDVVETGLAPGVISWRQISMHRVELRWTPPLYENGTHLSDEHQLQYRVFWTEDTSLDLGSVCGVGMGELQSLVFQPESPPLLGQTYFKLFSPKANDIRVTVIAYISHTRQQPYSPISVHLTSSSSFFPWYFWPGVVLLVLGVSCCGLGAWFIRHTEMKIRVMPLDTSGTRGQVKEKKGNFEMLSEEV